MFLLSCLYLTIFPLKPLSIPFSVLFVVTSCIYLQHVSLDLMSNLVQSIFLLPAISHHTKLKYLIPWALLKQMHFILQFLPFDSHLFLGKSFSNKLTCSLLMNYVFLNFSFYVTNLVECISPFACTINVDQKRESQERNEALQVNNEDLYFLMKLPKS